MGKELNGLPSKGGDWTHYDVGFRYLRHTTPILWDYFHEELYTEAVSGAGKGCMGQLRKQRAAEFLGPELMSPVGSASASTKAPIVICPGSINTSVSTAPKHTRPLDVRASGQRSSGVLVPGPTVQGGVQFGQARTDCPW